MGEDAGIINTLGLLDWINSAKDSNMGYGWNYSEELELVFKNCFLWFWF